MSKRLTQAIRSKIVLNAMRKSPINKQLEKVREQKKELGELIRIEALGGEEKAKEYDAIFMQLEELRKKLPDNMLTHTVGIYISSSILVAIEGSYSRFEFPNVVPCISNSYTIDKDSKLHSRAVHLLAEEERLQKELIELRNDVKASIDGITTLKRLLDSWPEAAELLPKDVNKPVVHLPAMRTDQLNKLIGLPTSK